jgi:hypothetical protein
MPTHFYLEHLQSSASESPSPSILFKCNLMVCSPNLKANKDNVQFYSAGSINQVTHLSQGGMILIAILRGGDYEKVWHRSGIIENIADV